MDACIHRCNPPGPAGRDNASFEHLHDRQSRTPSCFPRHIGESRNTTTGRQRKLAPSEVDCNSVVVAQ